MTDPLPKLSNLPDTGRAGWRHFAEMYGIRADDLPGADRILGEAWVDVEGSLREAVSGGPPELSKAVRHLTDAGGKRLRPALVALGGIVLHGRVCPELLPAAAAAEMLHTATLLHDDVLDEGDVRRGRPAVRVLWGNCMSVLGGDYVLVQALRMVLKTASSLLDSTLGVLEEMVAAEVLQLEMRKDIRFDAESAMRVINGKTASLFAWCTAAAARMAGDAARTDSLERYGRHLGVAFQIVDDLKDLIEDTPAKASKTVLGDLRNGTVSLPVVWATEVSAGLADRLRTAARDGSVEAPALATEVRATGALVRAADAAEAERTRAQQALTGLPEGPARTLLDALASVLVDPVTAAVRKSIP